MKPSIKVYSDFVCPFCFLAEHSLEKMAKKYDVHIDWQPFELRPEPTPQLNVLGDKQKMQAFEQYIVPRATTMGFTIVQPESGVYPYTGLAFQGFHFAKKQQADMAYYHAVAHGFFQEQKDIGDIQVLGDIAASIGLVREDFIRALESGTYKGVEEQALTDAYTFGVQGVPLMLIGDEKISGAVDEAIIEQAFQKLVATK